MSLIELLGLGRAGWPLVTLCSIQVYWKPLGHGDEVVLVQYYFPFSLHAMGTSFICVLVLRKVELKLVKWNNAVSIY